MVICRKKDRRGIARAARGGLQTRLEGRNRRCLSCIGVDKPNVPEDQTLSPVRNARASSIAAAGNARHRNGAGNSRIAAGDAAGLCGASGYIRAATGRVRARGENSGSGHRDHGRAGFQAWRRRRRDVLAQSGAARRGRRPGARRLSAAARARPRPRRACRRDRRSRQDARLTSRNIGWPIRNAPSSCRTGSARPISSSGRGRQTARRRSRAAAIVAPPPMTSASAIRNGRRTSSSTSSSRPIS